jgi:S1-C subfamily serine protease
MTHASTLIRLALACQLAWLSPNVQAENWILFDESRPSTGPQKTYIDSDSYRSEFGYLVYRIKIESNWFNSGRTVVNERLVLTDCRENRRFEASSLRELQERNFKSIYPGTTSAKELAVACQRFVAERSPSDQSIPKQSESTPKPRQDTSNAPDSTGSGVAISSNSVLTNAHVASDCKRVAIRQGSTVLSAQTVALDPRLDLAIVSTQQALPAQAKLRNTAMLGEDIMVAGFPLAGLLGSDLIVTGGQVNSLAGIRNDPTLLQISAPVQPGNSGGPLLDRSGSIVGIVVSKLNASRLAKITGDLAQNVNFAIKPEMVRLFLDANAIPFSSAQLGARIEGTELAKVARSFTYQILCFSQ